MGIQHNLELVSKTSRQRLFEQVQQQFNGVVVERGRLLDVNGYRLGFHESDALDLEVTRENYGVAATRTISFRPLQFSDPELENKCIQIVDFILRIEPGDAVFALNDGLSGVVLRRLGGKVVVYNPEGEDNPELGFMNADGRTHLSMPFEVKREFNQSERDAISKPAGYSSAT